MRSARRPLAGPTANRTAIAAENAKDTAPREAPKASWSGAKKAPKE